MAFVGLLHRGPPEKRSYAMARIPVAEGVFTWPSDTPRLIGSRCAACAIVTFPAQDSCPRCASTEMAEHLLSRRGRLWAWTTQEFPPPSPPYSGSTGEAFVPYGVGYVQLGDEVKRRPPELDGWRPHPFRSLLRLRSGRMDATPHQRSQRPLHVLPVALGASSPAQPAGRKAKATISFPSSSVRNGTTTSSISMPIRRPSSCVSRVSIGR